MRRRLNLSTSSSICLLKVKEAREYLLGVSHIGGLLERCGTFADVTLVTETSGSHALGGVTCIGVSFSGNHVIIKSPFCSSGGILVRHSSCPPGSIHKLVYMGSTPM